MYITAVPNRRSKPTLLLRESFREEGKVKNRTLANLSKLPPHAIEALTRVLSGETLISTDEAFTIERSVQHGHVQAVLATMEKLGIGDLIASRRSRERNLVLSMIASRVLSPASKLET
jgi:hypothetical protein